MRIKKVSQTTPTTAQVVDSYSASTTDSYSCNYVNTKANTYSTTEQRIGTWLGKPLYRKMVNINSLPNNAIASYSINIDNVDFYMINKIHSYIIFPNGNTQVFDYLVNPNDTQTAITAYNNSFNNNKPYISIYTGANRSGCSAYICLEYTKTTDTANS